MWFSGWLCGSCTRPCCQGTPVQYEKNCMVGLVEEFGKAENPPGETAVDSSFWNDLEGYWYREKNNSCIGEIRGGNIIWDIQWEMAREETPLYLMSSDSVWFERNDRVELGKIQRQAQTRICWSDGDIWLRK
mmetsp:Transcript_31427/g.64869  ORF Transcript_31427/g.64869 Transcript_31427/m.64869 type:complete len:132 (-) Transcript_31427:7-402(-)